MDTTKRELLSHTPCFMLSVCFWDGGWGRSGLLWRRCRPTPPKWSQGWLISRVPGLAGSQAYLSPLSDRVTRSSLVRLIDRPKVLHSEEEEGGDKDGAIINTDENNLQFLKSL